MKVLICDKCDKKIKKYKKKCIISWFLKKNSYNEAKQWSLDHKKNSENGITSERNKALKANSMKIHDKSSNEWLSASSDLKKKGYHYSYFQQRKEKTDKL